MEQMRFLFTCLKICVPARRKMFCARTRYVGARIGLDETSLKPVSGKPRVRTAGYDMDPVASVA